MGKAAYLPCGRIATAHGVRGTLRVESYCDSPEVLASLPTVYLEEPHGQYRPVRVEAAAPHGGSVLMTLDGIRDRNEALLLRGKTLFAAREDIPVPENAVLIADMIGLPVLDADSGRLYGRLADVQQAYASDMYDIETEGGGHVLFPAVAEFLDRVDTDEGIFIRPIPGFFEEA